MFTKLKRRAEGFTIIEVMIVLAIAGLIMLIVFLAVPALQRNARNTQRKNDVAAILAAVSEYSANNNGLLPRTATMPTITGGVLTWNPNAASGATVKSEAKVGYYNQGIGATNGSVNLSAGTVIAATTFNNATHDYVQIVTGVDCSGAATIAGSTRSFVAVYAIESGSNSFSQVCQAS